MEYGIYFWFGYDVDPALRFRQIRQAGFRDVMIWWGDEYQDIDGPKEKLPDLARNSRLWVENIHVPFERANSLWMDDQDGEELMRMYGHCIDACAQYEISTMVMHLTKGDNPPPMGITGLYRMKRLIEKAEKQGINIALENLRKPEYLEYIFSGTQSTRLGFCYDSGHENCYSKGIDLLGKYGHKLMALHLHDNDGTDDQHSIPGEGTVDWKSIRDQLRTLRYSGPITLEVSRDASPANQAAYQKTSCEDYLKKAFETARLLFER